MMRSEPAIHFMAVLKFIHLSSKPQAPIQPGQGVHVTLFDPSLRAVHRARAIQHPGDALSTAADQSASPPVTHASFAALRHPGFQMYFVATALAMLADNTEHVISYWVIFQKFHSPTLGGFAVVSHWLPFLGFSVAVGALNDRFDSRRIIQMGALLFIVASAGWGYFFVTGTLQMWQAMGLLVIHGCAGVLWITSSQMLLYDIVGPAALPSAVRLAATTRYLGVLVGPGVGSIVMLTLGPN